MLLTPSTVFSYNGPKSSLDCIRKAILSGINYASLFGGSKVKTLTFKVVYTITHFKCQYSTSQWCCHYRRISAYALFPGLLGPNNFKNYIL